MPPHKNAPLLPTLPLHLMMSMGAWLASPIALQCVNEGLPRSKKTPNPKLAGALEKEAKSRAHDFLSGVLRYLDVPYARNVSEPPAIWHLGNARLLDYSNRASADAVTLFVPSLINRYYILDLEENRSLLRHVSAQGIYPFVLDWGTPGTYEKNFSISDYITKILLPAVDFIHATTGQKVNLVGYCMGGVFTIAAAQLASLKVRKLALLATPWDFHCKAFAPFVVNKEWQKMIAQNLMRQKFLPAELIQSLFYMTDPWVFEHKFRRFTQLKKGSREAQDFVALERWVNDGVPMTAKAARDALIGWAQRNELMRGQWKMSKQAICPQKIKIPVFIAMPKNDHVVPYDCALPLAKIFSRAKTIHPSAGHVGMIVGNRAKKELWEPLVTWLIQK